MKNRIVMTCLAAGIALAGIAGCSSDAPTKPVEGTQYLKYNKGDSFHYAVYDRDTSNVNIEDSKTMETWVVVDTAVTGIAGQSTGVTRFEVTHDGSVTKDTVYVQSTATGVVQMYNVLGKMISRIAIAASFADSVPKQWVQISDTKTTNALTWVSTSTTQFNMNVSAGPISISAATQLSMNASHKGKQSTKAGDSTYTNAVHTDHLLHVHATDNATNAVLLNDDLAIHYDVDITAGIVRQSLDSKSVTLTYQSIPLQQPVTGFEKVLVSYTRVK